MSPEQSPQNTSQPTQQRPTKPWYASTQFLTAVAGILALVGPVTAMVIGVFELSVETSRQGHQMRLETLRLISSAPDRRLAAAFILDTWEEDAPVYEWARVEQAGFATRDSLARRADSLQVRLDAAQGAGGGNRETVLALRDSLRSARASMAPDIRSTPRGPISASIAGTAVSVVPTQSVQAAIGTRICGTMVMLSGEEYRDCEPIFNYEGIIEGVSFFFFERDPNNGDWPSHLLLEATDLSSSLLIREPRLVVAY